MKGIKLPLSVIHHAGAGDTKGMRYNACLLREGNGTPLQYSSLETPMDGGAWKTAVHRVAKGRTGRTYFTFTFHFHALEKKMATYSSVLI